MTKKLLFAISGLVAGLSMILVFTQDGDINTKGDVVVNNAEESVSATNTTNMSEFMDKEENQPQVSTTNKVSSEKQAVVEEKAEPGQNEVVDHLAAAFPDTSHLSPDEIGVDDGQLVQQEQEIDAERVRVESEIELPIEESKPDELSEAELESQRYELEQQISQEVVTALEEQAAAMTSDIDADLPPMEHNH